jgi:hypothetical protein
VPKQYFENCCDYIAQSVYLFYDLIIFPYIRVLSSANLSFVYYGLQVSVILTQKRLVTPGLSRLKFLSFSSVPLGIFCLSAYGTP